jgi:orotidine-5'-phosphate decarboxylase
LDFTDIAARYGKSEAEIHSTVERARRSLVPRTKIFTVVEKGRTLSLSITREGVGPITSHFGDFHHFLFAADDTWQKYSVLVMATLDDGFNPVFKNPNDLTMRIDSGCETGQLFGDRTCECRPQLHKCMEIIKSNGEGLIINIPRQDGRGLGLPFKLATLYLQTALGVHTLEASALLDPDTDRDTRTYKGVVAILRFFGIPATTRLHLISNNPLKTSVFFENGYVTPDLVPAVISPTAWTSRHLAAKQQEFGHINLIPQSAPAESETRRWRNLILDAINSTHSRVCCGLDPDLNKLPTSFRTLRPEEQVSTFLRNIVAITSPHVCAFKIQKAFFDALENGKRLLIDVIQHVHESAPGRPVILDCKVGDIDNSMSAYLSTAFGDLNADAIVLNPYMGTDVWDQLKLHSGKAGFVLVRTSNAGSRCVQEVPLLFDNNYLWRHILDLVLKEWQAGTDIMPILSANSHVDVAIARELRQIGVPILIAGVGAQSGDLQNVAELLRYETPIMINSSRAILYPEGSTEDNWRDAILASVIALQQRIDGRLVV